MKLSIYRYNPDKDAKPYMQDYEVALEQSDRALDVNLRAPMHLARVLAPAMAARGPISATSWTRVAEITRPGGPPAVTLPPPAVIAAAITT